MGPQRHDADRVHPTAIVHPQARITPDVQIGPYCIIEADVTIGPGTELGPRVTVHAGTRLGAGNIVRTGAVLGVEPQDFKYTGEKTELIIGEGNRIGEYCTISRGTDAGRGETRIGNDNYFMGLVHVGHDCVIGNDTVLTQNVALSGMTTIDDGAVLGGLVGVHQFVRIGRLAMIGALTKVTQDVPPYVIADGHPAAVRAINVVGLRRGGVDADRIRELRRAFRLLFRSKLSLKDAVAAIEEQLPASPERDNMIRFVESSRRGICR